MRRTILCLCGSLRPRFGVGCDRLKSVCLVSTERHGWTVSHKNSIMLTETEFFPFQRYPLEGELRRGIKFFVSALMLVGASTSALGAELYNETLENGTEVIFLNGPISSGDEERFRELSVKYKNAIVVLNSSGGMLKPALEIGRQIRLRGYRTLVMEDDQCASACALIWVAGTQRILSGDGKVGFHASYIDEGGRKVESGVANAMVGFYLSQLNLSGSAVIFTTLAPPDKVEWIRAASSGSVPIEFTVWKDPAKPAVVSIPPPIQTRPAISSTPAQASYQWLLSMRKKSGLCHQWGKGNRSEGHAC